MNQIQILLPLCDEDGNRYPDRLHVDLTAELTTRFGGVTVFSQGTADGLWRKGDRTERDTIVIFEVMTDGLERDWWEQLRGRLETTMQQNEIVVRALQIDRL